MPTTAPRFELHLIADSDLQDLIRFHERQAFKTGAQFEECIWRRKVCEGFVTGRRAGRGEASRLLFVGGLVCGVILGLLFETTDGGNGNGRGKG